MTSAAVEFPAVFYIGLNLGKVIKLRRYVTLVRARYVYIVF